MSVNNSLFRGYYFLLVDDEPGILLILSDYLKMLGAKVDEAINGQEALDYYQINDYDLIITDLMMPKLDGRGFLKNMQKVKASDTPVIVQSAVGTLSDAYTLMDEFNIADFLEKPVTLARFKFCVGNVLNNQKLKRDLNKKTDEIKQINSYLENIIETMSEVLIVIKPDQTIRTVNNTVCEMLGYTENELLNLPLKNIYDEIEGHNHVLISKDGHQIPVTLAILPLNKNDLEDSDYLYLATDMSDLKNAQLQVIQASKLSALGKMATGVAHEINQPLSFINGLLFDIQEDLEDDHPLDKELTIKAINQALKQVQRITDIIQHMRTFGKDDNASMFMVSAHQLIQDSLLLISERLRMKNIELILDLADSSPVICGNATQLEQVIINMIQNAIESFQGEKGQINLMVKLDDEKNNVIIQVQDNGPGIPAQVQNHIFDPFFTTKDVGKGTGLGLSTCHGIIEIHNGTIELKTEAGIGTSFLIHLPRINSTDDLYQQK